MIQPVSRAVRPEAVEPRIVFDGLLGFREVHAPAGRLSSVRWLEVSPAVTPGHATQPHLLRHDHARPEQGHCAFVRDRAGHVVELMERAPR